MYTRTKCKHEWVSFLWDNRLKICKKCKIMKARVDIVSIAVLAIFLVGCILLVVWSIL